ncbi:hypothetical protein NBRC3278_3580 [Acetobacter pasteurianus NBRC 3278]|uniref:Uncharacterized protein n=1 Tax=Acetobacter pasteurianus NBRC 3278 TaxID=1226660 RepID=A0A401X9S9_ACEPA|nr:hypothetical protein NBRC3278_3580 [Acetobacter pasteurianus NBRC 3278]
MVFGSHNTGIGDVAEGGCGGQSGSPFLNAVLGPEAFGGFLGGRKQAGLLNELGDHDIPCAQRHGEHDQQHAAGNDIPIGPQSTQTVGVGFFLGVCCRWGLFGRRTGGGCWSRRGCIRCGGRCRCGRWRRIRGRCRGRRRCGSRILRKGCHWGCSAHQQRQSRSRKT